MLLNMVFNYKQQKLIQKNVQKIYFYNKNQPMDGMFKIKRRCLPKKYFRFSSWIWPCLKFLSEFWENLGEMPKHGGKYQWRQYIAWPSGN